MTRGFPILVASLTHREDKRIFLLCHYFARRKTNPANSQAKSRRSHYGRADNPRGNIAVAHRQKWAMTGFLMESGIESKDMKRRNEHFIVDIVFWINC